MSSKRKCTFNDSLQKEFKFLKKSTISQSHVFCTFCSVEFSIACGGKSHILSHMNSAKHKNATKASLQQKSVSFFSVSRLNEKQTLLAAAEGTYAYHNVMHNNSFRQMDCTSKILKKIYDPSFSCARTKCDAIIQNVLGKHAMEELTSDLSSINYVSLYCDASNHGNIKLFPILVRYFKPEIGIVVKLLDFQEKPGETSDLIFSYITKNIKEHNLIKKVIAFCADNTNSNFGGCARKGTNNVYSKMKDELCKNIIGIGCSAHVLNNTIQTAADGLPLDIETILVKIYSHFHVFSVRVEALKDYCNYVNTEYHPVLGYSKTRWLSLLPAVTRLAEMFSPLRAYFLSQPKCPTVLRSFFENKFAELWLIFIKQQASLFHAAVQEVEGQNTTIIKVSVVLTQLLQKLEIRLSEKFVPEGVLQMLNDSDSSEKDKVFEDIFAFYSTAVEYLKKWIEPIKDFTIFQWMNLHKVPTWESIRRCHSFFSQNSVIIDDGALFDEYSLVKDYVQANISEWENESIPADQRWIKIFTHFRENYVTCENMQHLIEFIFSLPGSNAPTERVFSIVHNVWTTEKSSISISTLRSILIVKLNLSYSCSEFYDKLIKDEKMLNSINSSEKYLK